MKVMVGVLALCGFATGTVAQTALTYQKPPASIEELLVAPATPVVQVSPDHSLLLVQQPQSFPTIAEVAQPRYRLAGIRFNPATNGPSREVSIVKLWLQPLAGGARPGERIALSVPAHRMGLAGISDPNGLRGVGKPQHSHRG